MPKLDIRFYNTHNLVLPLLDHALPQLNKKGTKSQAYISAQKYRSSIKGVGQIDYFELAGLTKLAGTNKRLNQFLYALAASFKILTGTAQLNVFFTQPPLFIIWASWLSRIRGTRYIIHVQDLYPDFLGKTGHLNESGWLYQWLDKKMISALNKAEEIIVIGKCMERLIKNKVAANKVIHTSINIPSATKERNILNQLDKLNIKNKFNILYAGNMGMAHHFDSIISVAQELSVSHPDIHFLFVAQGKKRNQAENYLEQGFSNMTLIKYPPHEVFMSLLLETDLHYISLRPEFSGILVPSKFYSSLAIGKPILFEGPAESEVGIQMTEHGLGAVIDLDDKASLKSAILKYYSDQELLAYTGKAVQSFFDEHCDIEKVISNYTEILTK